MVTLARRAQRIPFAPVVATLFGIVAAILVAAVPQWLFESGVVASGLPGIWQAAAPPLNLLARLLAIALAFAVISLLLWMVLAPLTNFIEAKARARTPWRDTGYDIDIVSSRFDQLLPRRPIFAPDELGAPLMSDEAVTPPSSSSVSQPELVAPVVIEQLQPVITAPDTPDNSIATLINRLENGLARRSGNDAHPDSSDDGAMPLSQSWIVPENVEASPAEDGENVIRQALGTLRQMARG